MAATATTTMTEADLRPAVEELMDEIVNGTDEHWQMYATRMAAEVAAGFKIGLFRVWSSNNRFYLAAQARRRPRKVHGMYAGVDQWRKRRREVREGEEPFVIFGPPVYRRRVQNNQPQQGQPNTPANNTQTTTQQTAGQNNGQQPQQQVVYGFRRPPIIHVYDYSQTYSIDEDFVEPDWSVPLAGGDLRTLDRLAKTSPVPVVFRDLGSNLEHGWLDSTGITVDSSRTAAEQIWTLAHELAHYHLGHLDQIATTRAQTGDSEEVAKVRAKCEQEAALAQFFTMKMLGLDESVGVDITAAAGQYLRSWMKDNPDGTQTPIAGHKGRRKLLRTRMDAGFRAAQQIVTAYAQYEHDAPAA